MESELTKQWNSNPTPRPRLGVFGLLRESAKTIKINRKLMFPLTVLVFLVFSHLDFAQIRLLKPLGKDLASQLAEHPKLFEDFGNNMHQPEYSEALSDIRAVLLVKFFIFTLSSIISLVFLVATVSSSSEAYTAKVLNVREVIMKIKKSWKKPILTHSYMILITIGFIFMCLFYIGMVSIFAVGFWAYVLYGVVFISIMVLGIYVSALWMMSLVVSVLEDTSGMEAISRGRELMKGERVKASLLVVVYFVSCGLVHLMTSSIRQNMEKWPRMVISIALTNGLVCALKLFVFVVFTIFYHELKESCDEKEAKAFYQPVDGDEKV